MGSIIKLSAPATREFWKIPVLFEDAQLLAIDKPSRLLTSPDRYDPERPNLMKLLHRDIARNAPWVQERALTYLANAHRLDFETSGVLLLAKTKPTLIRLANLFGAQKPLKTYIALVQGSPQEDAFVVSKKLGPHPTKLGLVRVDQKNGKAASTHFKVLERFRKHTLLECHPETGRTHQIRVHLQFVRLPLVADSLYGGTPLLLSRLKPNYRQKPDVTEKPLIERVALHAAELTLPYPAEDQNLVITSPWPKDMNVALKYLRRFAQAGSTFNSGQQLESLAPSPAVDQEPESASMASEQTDQPDSHD